MDLERLVLIAKSKDIPLGAVQALVSRLWGVSAGKSRMYQKR
jgi:hypothetical protein